jgi:ABC-type transport system involved in multi-copper enzyme maturation permease subunit
VVLKIAEIAFLPVVQRELREGARRPFNYWLRVAGATAGVLLLYSIHSSAGGNQAAEGLQLFTSLHVLLLALICCMVPAMSADCIARETREGTLGLLFLTPLTAMGIVLGKVFVQAIRAFTLWLAVLPVLIIPFVSGGVTTGDIASALTIEFCVTLLCLAAGLLASSLAKARSTAFLLAAGFAVGFICIFAAGLGLRFFWKVRTPGESILLTQAISSGEDLITGQPGGPTSTGVVYVSGLGWLYRPPGTFRGTGVLVNGRITRIGFGWSTYFSALATRNVWRSLLLESGLAVPLLVLLVLRIAAYRVAHSWREKPPSVRRENWIKTFCMPLAQRRFARKMQRALDRNPIAWLQQYSWKARLSKWGLCLAFVLLECAATTGNPSEILAAQPFMLLILAAAFTFVGVNSFLTEKKSGALELLLVTPVSPNQIIFGRVWGLWKQFLPAGVTLLLVWVAAENMVSNNLNWIGWPSPRNNGIIWSLVASPLRASLRYNLGRAGIIGYGYYNFNSVVNPTFKLFVTTLTFLTLPVFATYFALRVKNLIVAAALTWLALFGCPFFAFSVLGLILSLLNAHLPPASLYAAAFLSNLTFALLACFLLRHSLSRRIYAF